MKRLNNSKGFTLIEMMIVLVVISILLLALIPNMTKNQSVATEKGCEATVEMVQAQVMAYKVKEDKFPVSLSILVENEYIDHFTCESDQALTFDPDSGKVSLPKGE